MQDGEKKLLAPQMHSITIALGPLLEPYFDTLRKGGALRFGGIERNRDIRKKVFRGMDEREECIKEIHKKTDAENI